MREKSMKKTKRKKKQINTGEKENKRNEEAKDKHMKKNKNV